MICEGSPKTAVYTQVNGE